MSRVWICLNLICAATYFLHSSASSEGVKVKCPGTVGVDAGQTLTFNCSVIYNIHLQSCIIKTVQLNRNNVTVNIPFEEESPNNVSLSVSNVTKSDNWTVKVITDCGLGGSNTIEVQVSDPPSDLPGTGRSHNPELDSKDTIILGVCVSLIFVLLFGIIFLYTKRRKTFRETTLLQTLHCRLTNADMQRI